MISPELISVSFSGKNDELAALEFALEIAKIHDSHVSCWNVAPNPEDAIVPYAAYDVVAFYPEQTVEEMKKSNEENRIIAEQRFNDLIQKFKIKKSSFHHTQGQKHVILSMQARVSDITVMGRTDKNVNLSNTANEVLFSSAHPLILVPPAYKVKEYTGNVLLAWNGSRESARAITSALPYLKQGNVSILTVEDSDKKALPLSSEDLAQYLRRHGVKLNIILDEGRKTNTQEYLLKVAQEIDAEMIVMGAWGHSRIRELILGGVTDFMLHNADIPVFMEH